MADIMKCLFDRFLLRESQFGITKFSKIEDVIRTIGTPEEGWEEDGLMCYEDLEIGLIDSDSGRRISYFGIYPGNNDEMKFSVLHVGSEEFKEACFNMGHIVNVLIRNRIEFKYHTQEEETTGQKCLVTKFEDELYFSENKNNCFTLSVAFMNSI